MVKAEIKKNVFLIWDSGNVPSSKRQKVFIWNNIHHEYDPSYISIPKLVDENAEKLKSRYLEWIYDLGESNVAGKKVIDHLEVRKGFSYWWMTSIAQKFNASDSSEVNNVIKLLQFESLVNNNPPSSIELVTENKRLILVLKDYCERRKLDFNYSLITKPIEKEPIVKAIYKAMPYYFQAFIYFIWTIINKLPYLLKFKKSSNSPEFKICFIDVFNHLDEKSIETGKFISNYWTILAEKLFSSKNKITWNHNYTGSKSFPNIGCASKLNKKFNETGASMQEHYIIDEYLNIFVLLKMVRDYFKINLKIFRDEQFKKLFHVNDSSICLWYLFCDEWHDSIKGRGAIVNLLKLALFEYYFSTFKKQKVGVYVQENQPWEMALVYAWKMNGHEKLIGVPHTTVRFWDLRYFYDPKTYTNGSLNKLPTPDFIAVNGPVAKKIYADNGFPKTSLVEAEALRYFHLNKKISNSNTATKKNNEVTVLISGDFLLSTTHVMLNMLSTVCENSNINLNLIFKPHPGQHVNLEKYSDLNISVSNDSLSNLFEICDVVFSSNITSVAIDAYYQQLPLIQINDRNGFNMSPLRNMKDVIYVNNSSEFKKALFSFEKKTEQKERDANEYFFLNKDLPKWEKILDINLL